MSDDPQTFQLPDPEEQPEEQLENTQALLPGDSTGLVEPSAVEPSAVEPLPSSGIHSIEPDVLSEIRQSLALEETEQARKTSTTGRLIRRITGSLKRVTGPLGRTGPLSLGAGEESSQPDAPSEIPDDFVSGRLEGTTVSDQPVFRTEPVDFYQQAYEEAYASVSSDDDEPGSSTSAENYLLEEQPLTGDEPISLLDSGVIAALGKEEEEARAAENEPDWMAEIRKETVEQEGKPAEPDSDSVPPSPPGSIRGITNPLRSFITGVLGGEGRRKRAEAEMPDDLVTGRLNRSMNTGPLSAPPSAPPPASIPAQPLSPVSNPADEVTTPDDEEKLTGTGALRALLGGSMESPVTPAADQGVEDRPTTGSLRKSFFVDLDEYELETGSLNPDKLIQSPPPAAETTDQVLPEDRFDIFDRKQPDKPGRPLKQTGGIILDEPLDLTPEEEQLLFKLNEQAAPSELPLTEHAQEPLMFTEEDIWGTPAITDQPHTAGDGWIEPGRVPTEPAELPDLQLEPITDEDYARSFLTGSLVPQKHEEEAPVNLMQQALEKARPDEFNAQDLRAIALEGMMDDAPSSAGYASAYGEETDWENPNAARFSLKTWFTRRSAMEKVLLVEAVVAALAILVAVPFFIFVIAGGRVPTAAAVQTNWIAPRPLPANLPYPVGLTLPGGWSFPLQKSTFINGEWRPASAEWLEGTELRRVVALPWNRQTEAVIQTFKIGDKIQVDLSNRDTLDYKVKSIDRIPTRDTEIYSDLSPSLIIVLYKEDSPERWVVQCQPTR